MVIKRRIETSEAKALRSQRQEFAAPGGRHDRLIGFLARALPMGVGLVAALMVITPLSPRGEVSFLLDRKQVEVIDERLSVDNAMYRGRDNQAGPQVSAPYLAIGKISDFKNFNLVVSSEPFQSLFMFLIFFIAIPSLLLISFIPSPLFVMSDPK